MSPEFAQVVWDDQVENDCRHIVRLAVREDLDRTHDWTTLALVAEHVAGHAVMTTRQPGVIAGLLALPVVLDEMEVDAACKLLLEDGTAVQAGTRIAELHGKARHLLTAERLLLNLVGRLSGIATLARQYASAVREVSGNRTRVYDTRKTTPGWRRLEKYAVRCGGGWNHRMGLFDAVLIKDNHLALRATQASSTSVDVAGAVASARGFLRQMMTDDVRASPLIVEVEVDSLEQLKQVLPVGPDIVLLDNMTSAELRKAVALRDELNPHVELEASGGIDWDNVRDVAQTGVERISIGALTHSAAWLDIGLDWVG